MADNTVLVNMKVVSDISDVVSNVGAIQKSFSKLKLPEKLGEGLNKNITEFYKEYDKYQKKVAEGLKTQGDYNQVEKSLNRMKSLYETIGKEASKVTKLDLESLLDLGSGDFKKIADEIADVIKQINQVKIDPSAITKQMSALRNSLKGDKFSKNGGLLDQLIGNVKSGNLVEAKKVFKELQIEVQKIMPKTDANGDFIAKMVGKLNPANAQAVTNALREMGVVFSATDNEIDPLNRKLDELQTELQETKNKATGEILGDTNDFNEYGKNVEKVTDSLKRMHQEEFNFNRQATDIGRQVQQFFGLSQVIRKVGDIARSAFSTVKELDKAMTETAVVTNFSVGDMWDMLPTYTAQANQLGSTIRDVYEAATLYYQQGLNTNQAMGLANETLKMARIAGLDAKDATDMMTAALRGFNMEVNQMSAQKINDIYSELAAITASDTKEIGSAMERTASIANSANMEFATTSAFLAQMIETTREAPENLGTAMKTIVARFQEMKQDPTKLVDSEGVAMDANKVDKALKTIGVDLMNTKGEFRDLDDVFLDISAKWDSLTQGQQRYIATIAAGSRQQSRFIAMMSNYERTMELVDAANNSAGASQRQFEKTLDSMEAKLNKLKNAWDQFTMGLMNNQILKFGVDVLTEGFTIINKFIDVLGKIPPKPFEGITKSILTLVSTLALLHFGGKGAMGLTGGVFGWASGEGFKGGFKAGWGTAGSVKNKKDNSIVVKAKADATAYRAAVQQELSKNGLASAIGLAWKNKNKNFDFTNSFDAAFGQFSGERFAASWSTDIEAELTRLLNSVVKDGAKIGEVTGKEFKTNLIAELQRGKISGEQFKSQVKTVTGKDIGSMGVNSKELEQGAKAASNFGEKISFAGDCLIRFGAVLEGTPLAPFGTLLTTIGMTITSLGTAITWVSNSFMIGMGKVIAAEGAGAAMTKILAGGFKQLWIDMGPLGWAILGITALATAYMALKDKIPTAANKLNQATDAAAAAADAYDSAKQETSELANSIEQIKTNEDAFDGLVVGTAAFNEQLVTANEQIMELIKKYPMLNDPKYLSTDKNGLMHISDEGLNAVKEYQKQRQANASALNLIQTANLNSIEAEQKAKQMRKTRGTDTLETLVQRKKEADLVEQQAKAQTEMAKLNAVNTSLVDKEINNREKVSAILASQYDARREAINLEGESIHDLKQEYADFYGYKYDQSTKKLTDIEGNEVNVDNKTIKDAVTDIRVLTDIEVDGKSLDSMINHVDRTFSQALGDSFEESGSLFSDILSDNINIEDDLLQNLITNPDKLQNAVNSLSEKEIAAVLGVSADAVEQAPDKYKDELTDKLTEKAINIAETQAQSYADLASMLAQTTSADINQIISENGSFATQSQVYNKQIIEEQLKKLTTEQKNTLSTVGKALSEGAGAETMRTFIKQATDIYTKGTEKSITTLDAIIKDVNWSSPTARLKAYNDMINSADKSVQTLGQDLRNSSESSNLLGEAFTEFYNSSDFQDMADNMDKFADASGRLNASSVHEMAQECGSLNKLLDTGAISAGGVAAALNAMGKDGSLTIFDLNENLLKFLSTANQLDDVLSEAHDLIENFDWGIDTGESEDFAKDSTKKWKELYDNGEFGNQQLENYVKFVLGQERWNKELEESGGNIEVALGNMSKDILKYSDGFEQAWVDMANSGAKKYRDVHWDDNGDIIWETEGKTTDELVQWLAKTRGITQEWAKLMVEDFANYSYDFKTELAANDYKAALEEGDYIKQHQGADGTVNMTQNELTALAAAQNKTEDEILKDIQKYGKVSEDQLNVIKTMDKDGNLLMGSGDIKSLNEQYSQAELGKDTKKSWLSQYQAVDRKGNTVDGSTDLKTAISAAMADGFQQEQATEMARVEAYEAFKDGAQVFYDGVELNEKDLEDSQAFAEKIAEITENSRWNAVGEAIAQGYISYIRDAESPGQNSLNNTGGTLKDSETQPSSRMPRNMASTATEDYKQGTELTWRDKVPGWVSKLIDIYNNPPKEGTTELTPAQQQKMYGSSGGIDNTTTNDNGSAELINASASLTGAAEQLTTGTTSLTTAGESLSTAGENLATAGQNLNSAAAILAVAGQNNGSGSSGGQSSQGSQGNQSVESSVSGVIVVDNSAALQALEDVKAKADEAKASIESGATFGVEVTGVDKLDQASKDAASLASKNGSSASIAVSTGAVDKGSVKKAIGEINQSKATILVDANTKAAEKKARDLANKIDSYHATIDVSTNVRGQNVDIYVTKHVTEAAKGLNNKISHYSLPSLGSLAKGSRYGRLGPRGKGGLTLTGEEGYEIAWLPSESRSMILGANGPQMINLPADAVVYTHEQSEDILKKKQEIEAGSHAGRHTKTSSGGGSKKSKRKEGRKGKKGKKSKSKSKSSSKDPTLNLFSIQEVVRFNIDQAISDLNADISKREKEIEKGLSKIGASYKSISDVTKKQISALKQIQTKNQQLLASYQAQLKEYRSQEAYVKWTTNSGESKNKKIKIKDYLNADGSVNQAAISKLGSRAEREAVFKEVSSAKSLVDGIQKAQDEIDKAGDQIEELGEKITEQFFLWENELTRVYNLTQKINNLNSLSARFASQIELETSKLGAGFGSLNQSIKTIRQVTVRNNDTISKQIAVQQEMIAARQEEMKNILTAVNQARDLEAAWADKKSDVAIKKARVDTAKSNYDAAKIGYGYLKNLKQDLDGSLSYDIDWKQIAADRTSGKLSKETYDMVKSYLDSLNDSVTEFNESITTQTDTLKELYETYRQLEETVNSFGETLLDGLEAIQKEREDDLKKMSTLVSKVGDNMKDLLDQVKKSLDERRKQEDNRKTEEDISKKQQRLAALQADTSGGNQVQIAQLQKEITDAQQNYQRTLEDQLLERLQTQNDEAIRQRERLISVSEAQLAIEAANNLELVNLLLKDPFANKNQIVDIFRAAIDYDDKLDIGKQLADQDFNSQFASVVTAVDQIRPMNYSNALTQINSSINNLQGILTQQNASKTSAQAQVTAKNTTSTATKPAASTTTPKVATPAAPKAATKTTTTAKTTAAASKVKTQAEKDAELWAKIKANFGNLSIDATKAKAGGLGSDALRVAKAHKGAKVLIKGQDAHVGASGEIYWDRKGTVRKWNPSTGQVVQQKYNKKQYIKEANSKNSPYVYEEYRESLRYHKVKGYKTGGLASETGPAYLHGTPSKPELVLNAQDTKNFIALKDVLSKAVHSSNFASTSYGDATYEININVDKISSDYDVDKMAERVKKIIVSDSSYRNVTQVRKFR